MYNSEIPTRAELPTTAQLIRSTIVAIVTAAILLVTIVLPAEYAIDPTGVGRILKLTEMGEIKAQLAAEAEADRKLEQQKPVLAPTGSRSSLNSFFAELFVSSAVAEERIIVAQGTTAPASSPAVEGDREDDFVVVLKPREGAEYKLEMQKGAQAQYTWRVEGGVANYDLHGTQSGGSESSYKKGRGVSGDEGVLTAGYDGIHGWFWRNRGKSDVTITLRTKGTYSNPKRVK